jgi:hypothetical protein
VEKETGTDEAMERAFGEKDKTRGKDREVVGGTFKPRDDPPTETDNTADETLQE